MTIRSGTADDFEQVFDLIKEFSIFQQTPERVLTSVDQMKAEASLFRCFVAQDENLRIVGFASYFFAYYSWTGKAIYLDDLYVARSCRSRGTGTKLLQAIIDLCKKENCKKLRWQVSKWNEAAIGFYKKMGAVTDDVEMNCDLFF